jgi:hypothetical protein
MPAKSKPSAGARTAAPKPTARARRLERELRETRAEIRTIRAKATLRRLKESNALDYDWVGPWLDVLSQRQVEPGWWPLGGTSARRYGHYFPFFQSEQQLTLLRDLSRIVVGTNNYAQGMLGGLTNFVIGTGYKVKATATGAGGKANADRLTDFLDRWSAENLWGEFQREAFWRHREDGDELIRLFPDDGIMKVRHVWPEQLTQPPGTTVQEWGYGVRMPRGDECAPVPEAYWVADLDDPHAGEEVPASELVHLKANSRTGIKRGLPDFSFGTKDALDAAGRLTRNLGEGAAIREAIAMIRQHAAGTGAEEVEEFRTADADFKERVPFDAGTYRPVNSWDPGTFVDVPEGMQHAGAPANAGTPAHTQVVQVLLRSAGVRWNAPEWLVSGDASNMGAYTSSLVAESPFVKSVAAAQDYYKARFLQIVRKAVAVAVAHGLLPGGVMEGVTLDLVPPSPEVRNKTEEAQRAAIEIPLGVDSRQRYCESQDRDYEKVAEENQQYADQFGAQGQGPGLPMPGDDGSLPGDDGGAGTGLPESLLEEETDEPITVELRLLEAEKAPPGKVWKQITYQRGGKSVTQKRLVNAPQAKAGAQKKSKPDPQATAAAVKAQLAGDASKLTPAKVKDLGEKLSTLTVDQLKAIKREHDIKGGRTKADHVARLLDRAKELKKRADAERRAAKKAPAAAPPKEEPRPAEKPPEATPAASEPHPVAKSIVMQLNSAPGLTDEQREHYGRAVARVVRAMPKEALDRVAAHLDRMSFHPSIKDIPQAMIDQLADQPGLTPTQRDAIRKQYDYLKGMSIGGVYMNGFKTVHVDGDAGNPNRAGRHGQGFGLAHSIYAHELTHAVDGPDKQLSNSPEWADAYKGEIAFDRAAAKAGKVAPPLTDYAGEKPSEGLAEFGRLVYASDVPHSVIAEQFPKATAVFKSRGLWPAQERTGDAAARMPDIFSQRVEVGTDGSHADILKGK